MSWYYQGAHRTTTGLKSSLESQTSMPQPVKDLIVAAAESMGIDGNDSGIVVDTQGHLHEGQVTGQTVQINLKQTTIT